MKPILIILPSKGRPEKIEGLYDTWRKTTDGLSEIVTFLDIDDPFLNKYKRHNDIRYDIDYGKSFGDVCNRAFKKFSNYKYYYVLSDDHRIRTKKWEKKFIEIIEQNGGKGVSYGNDLVYGEELGSSLLVSGNIFRALGHCSLPGLIHMFTDSYWMELGRGLKKLFYFPEIIIEHMHFSVGKSRIDSMYLSADNKEIYDFDKKIFNNWKRQQKNIDLERILSYKGK